MTVKLKINQIRAFLNLNKNEHLQEIKIEKDETINYRVINNMSDNNKIQINNLYKKYIKYIMLSQCQLI